MLDVPARLADGGGDSGVDRWRSRDSVQQQERKAESLAVRGSFTAAGADIHMTLELRLNDFCMSESSPQRRVADGSPTRRPREIRYGNVTMLGWTRHAVVAASGDANRGDIRCTTQGPFRLRD
jgi:hypothetical protein